MNDPVKVKRIIKTKHRMYDYAEAPIAGYWFILHRYTGLIHRTIDGTEEDAKRILELL